MPLGDLGHISAPEVAAPYARHAGSIRKEVVALMRKRGAVVMADRLDEGGNPGDEEFAYLSKVLGGAFIVTSQSDLQPSIIHGSF